MSRKPSKSKRVSLPGFEVSQACHAKVTELRKLTGMTQKAIVERAIDQYTASRLKETVQ